MIGKLKGVVDSFGEDFVILDVSGVGYIVHCSARTLQRMPKVGEPAELSIETHVREDMIRLYGFRSDAEREWFRLLQTVQGVGARVALGVLSVLEPEALASAIATGDKGSISRAPGVGPRPPPGSPPSSRTRPRPSRPSTRRWSPSRAPSRRAPPRSR